MLTVISSEHSQSNIRSVCVQASLFKPVFYTLHLDVLGYLNVILFFVFTLYTRCLIDKQIRYFFHFPLCLFTCSTFHLSLTHFIIMIKFLYIRITLSFHLKLFSVPHKREKYAHNRKIITPLTLFHLLTTKKTFRTC